MLYSSCTQSIGCFLAITSKTCVVYIYIYNFIQGRERVIFFTIAEFITKAIVEECQIRSCSRFVDCRH